MSFWGRTLGRLGKQIRHFTAQKIYISGQVAAHSGSPQAEVDVTVWQWECRQAMWTHFISFVKFHRKEKFKFQKK
jgi:hypothetical protein